MDEFLPEEDEPTPTERRGTERVAARFEVRFSEGKDAARALRAYSVNFSIGGLCLKTKQAYTQGSVLHLNLKVGEGEFNIECVVAWAREGTIGARFDKMSPTERERLYSMLENQLKVK